LSPRGNVHHFIHPGVDTLHYLDEWRGEQRISSPGDNFMPRDKIQPWGTTSPLGVKVCP
jgi:hypothetical protein